MEPLWQWGLAIIHHVQRIRSPFFDSFFSSVSFFGTVSFYVVFLPVLYWCFDRKHARRVLIIFLISGWVNSVCKDFFNHPRPYNLDETVKIGKTTGPGLPSGHAQMSLTVWGYLMLWIRKPVFSAISTAVILLIAFSRIYLGVHFPTDIFGGWILAAIILFTGYSLADKVEEFVSNVDRRLLAVSMIVLPALMSLFYPSPSSLMSSGTLSGFVVGIVIETAIINFSEVRDVKRGLLRYLSGVMLLALLFSAGRLIPGKSTSAGMIAVYIHSWIMGFAVSAGVPWFYKRAGI